MSKELYVEALADAKKLKEIAEDNAKRALVEAVTPRIRDLIEKELLNEEADSYPYDPDTKSSLASSGTGAPGGEPRGGRLITDDLEEDNDLLEFMEEDDKIENESYGISAESVSALAPLLKNRGVNGTTELESGMFRLNEELELVKRASATVMSTNGYGNKIDEMISRLDNMYDYVQESLVDSSQKSKYELRLESFFKELKKLQEHRMKRLQNLLSESEVNVKLKGLPEISDEDMGNLEVELIFDEGGGGGGEEEEGGEEEDLFGGGDEEEEDSEGGDEEGGEEEDLFGGGDEEEEDSEGGDEEGGDEEEEDEGDMMESRFLGNNAVVEIDEGMLRREIGRMKMLREAREKRASGDVIVEIDEGMLRREIGRMKMLREAAAADKDLDEDDLDEADLDEDAAIEVVDHDGEGADESWDSGNEHSNPSLEQHNDQNSSMSETLRRRYVAENNLIRGLNARVAKLQREAAMARSMGERGKVNMLNGAIVALRKRINESAEKARKISRVLAEANSRLGRSQNGRPNRPAERLAETNLRNKLAETNLFNAKLIYTNKLLQNDSLSKRQKASVIERLDEARSLREVKLVYESLVKSLAGSSRPLNESYDRRVIGSSSRPTRPASTTLNEGVETDRWAKLAGITK